MTSRFRKRVGSVKNTDNRIRVWLALRQACCLWDGICAEACTPRSKQLPNRLRSRNHRQCVVRRDVRPWLMPSARLRTYPIIRMIFPGFMMFFGSSACLIARIVASSTGEE